ncbi:hypothetical protein EF834_08730 [Rhodococcus spongiicola]|uniref:Uncharacterized protein n=1 Tax=Rhodococcus spongiicola TaxID=2487352 RepID=A0A438AX00_9NOCA|nr:hypothetical protein EF834_08730 [Rhodococcus spongiicola]
MTHSSRLGAIGEGSGARSSSTGDFDFEVGPRPPARPAPRTQSERSDLVRPTGPPCDRVASAARTLCTIVIFFAFHGGGGYLPKDHRRRQ